MIYPKFPDAGDTIGICAPSAGVGDRLDSFDASLEMLRSEGFYIKETSSVRFDACPSADPSTRGSEFNSLFSDDSVSAVISASGGDYCMEMLPYIDQSLVRNNPKWFAGYSDPTCIEMLITTRLDIATIYGVNAGAWDRRPLHEYQKTALSVLKGAIPVQHSYERYSASGLNENTGLYEMDADVKWEVFGPSPDLDVTGRLIGGCIDVIDCIIGTPYEDLEGFSEKYADDGLIWYFDNFAMDPLQLQYSIRRMQFKGLFDNTRAAVFGRTMFPGSASDADYLSQLSHVFDECGVPLIWNADIGHTKPSMTLINGAIGHLIYKSGRAALSMELK